MVDYKKEELLTEIRNSPFDGLMYEANRVRKELFGDRFEVCSIVNAKSGRCPEDCRFCAQSVRYTTNITEYPLRQTQEIVDSAVQAKEFGAERFGIVTSGNRLSREELCRICECVAAIKERTGLGVCGSLGALDSADLALLKAAGMSRYHHNIETSRAFYPNIVSTHDFEQRITTIKRAKKVGLEICSGGIIGIGESWCDRLDMALTLEELDVDSVPLNFLIPIKGTPLENAPSVTAEDALRTIMLFRAVLKNKSIKIIAGRESVLRDFQGAMFLSGANGMMVGGYLTVGSRRVQDDLELAENIRRIWKNT